MRIDYGPLRAVRIELDLSQAELAQRAGLSQAFVSRLETGRAKFVPVGQLLALARALGTPLTDLYRVVE